MKLISVNVTPPLARIKHGHAATKSKPTLHVNLPIRQLRSNPFVGTDPIWETKPLLEERSCYGLSGRSFIIFGK